MADLSFPITSLDILLQCIPQRPPVVMIDQLVSHSEDYVVAGFCVPQSGVFIENEELQEAGLIEHMAQSVALLTGYGFFTRKEKAPIGYIGSISNLEITTLPAIGQTIRTTVKILQEFSGITLVDIISETEDTLLAKGQMKTVIASQ